ncbi:hypothetical protein ACIA5G_39180 [Amycolatopsis sp. NPDC051758]|uniref:hypothetical protein n=1 Tax=Amycolatopsis sp. NPDC051758 TaxID=3363935 RepID=UPI00378B25F1
MMTLAVIVVCGLLGAAAAVFRARRAGRAAISEAELDRRLGRLHRSECMPTDEERRRRAANLEAILADEPLVRAPRPVPRPKAQRARTRPFPRRALVHYRAAVAVCVLWPWYRAEGAVRALRLWLDLGVGLLAVVACGIGYLAGGLSGAEAIKVLGGIFALFTALRATSTLDLGARAGRLHIRTLHKSRHAEVDEPAERNRHPHEW